MKFVLSLATLAALASFGAAPALAADDHEGHHAGPAKAAPAAYSEGTVKKVDKAAGKITISHGPLANLDMPPMTMAFATAQPAMLDKVKAGDKIRFVAERVGGVFTVTALEVAQ